MKPMHLATECMFLFKDELYKQVDGIGIGSPLGCTMANFLISFWDTLKRYLSKIKCLVTLNYMFAILMMCFLDTIGRLAY